MLTAEKLADLRKLHCFAGDNAMEAIIFAAHQNGYDGNLETGIVDRQVAYAKEACHILPEMIDEVQKLRRAIALLVRDFAALSDLVGSCGDCKGCAYCDAEAEKQGCANRMMNGYLNLVEQASHEKESDYAILLGAILAQQKGKQ